jgi:hypothetical protein
MSIKACRLTSETELHIVYESVVEFRDSRGLPEVFNAAIEARLAAGPLLVGEQTHDKILVLVYDDIWLDDAQIGEHLLSDLGQFDVIGVAGSVGRVAGQPSWFDLNSNPDIPLCSMSGMICHGGNNPCGEISFSAHGISRVSCWRVCLWRFASVPLHAQAFALIPGFVSIFSTWTFAALRDRWDCVLVPGRSP